MVDTSHPTFELTLTGSDSGFTVRADEAEAAFDWRIDSTALAMDLGALAHAAIEGKRPENDLHVTFGKRLFDAAFRV